MSERITRRDFAFKVIPLILGGAALACARANGTMVALDALGKTPTPTPFQPEPQTPIPFKNEVLSPTLTPTEVPRNPFLYESLDLSKEGELTLDIVLDKKSYKVSFLIKPGELGQPGENAGATANEGCLYILLYLHSGYHNNQPLEAEFLRNYIEGYKDITITNEAYVLSRLKSLEGLTLSISQGNDQEKFEIYGAAKIPHEQKPIFDLNNLSTLDVITQYAVGSPEKFEYFRKNQGILLTFCGWGPENSSRDRTSPNYRYTYSQYVLGLRPIND